jgi:WD40 repeat protein
MCRRLTRPVLATLLLLALGRAPAAEPARLDLQGDPLPPRAIARLGTVRLRDRSGAPCLAFSPDGKALVSGGELRAWDVATGKDLGWFRDRVPALAVHFSPDGKTLLALDRTGTIRWLEAGTGKRLREAGQSRKPGFSPTGALVSADGRVVGLYDPYGNVCLWDAATGESLLRREPGGYGPSPSAALSPDGKLIAVSRPGNRACLLDVATGKEIRQVEGPNRASERSKRSRRRVADSFSWITFSPDCRLLAASGWDFVTAWEVTTGRPRYTIRGHSGRLAFSPDGKYLACGGDEEIRLYSADSGTEVRRFDRHAGFLHALAFSPDGTTLASAQEYVINLWDVKTGRRRPVLPGHEDPVSCVAFSPDGLSLASGDARGDTVLVWDVRCARPRYACTGHGPGVLSVAYAPDGKTLATGDGYWGDAVGGLDARIRLWGAADGRLLRDFHGHLNSVQSLAFAPDSRRLASAGHDARARLWDAATGECLYQVRGADSAYRAVAFAPDGKALAVAGYPGGLSLRRADTAELLRELGPNGARGRGVLRLAFLPDGRTVLSCEFDGALGPATVRLWDADGGRLLRSFPTDVRGDLLSGFALSPDGKTVALASQYASMIQLWDTASEKPVLRLHGPEGASVTALAFSPDGRFLASGSADTTVLLWGVARARLQHLWSELTAGPGGAARAARQAAATPEEAVPFLKERLGRIQDVEGRAGVLLADLDDDRFDVREKASRKLGRLGPGAALPLGLALNNAPSVEARRRIEKVLEDQERAGEDPAAYGPRGVALAVAVLEEVGTPEARRVLQELARGPAESVVAREARAGLERLARRRSSP